MRAYTLINVIEIYINTYGVVIIYNILIPNVIFIHVILNIEIDLKRFNLDHVKNYNIDVLVIIKFHHLNYGVSCVIIVHAGEV